ncbi:hypothetical protein CapIbe_017343 [Capra ibex]
MGQLRHVHHPLPAQHFGHALAPPICQPGPTRAQWSRWGSFGQQLGNRPPVVRQGERASEVSPGLLRWSSARGPRISWPQQLKSRCAPHPGRTMCWKQQLQERDQGKQLSRRCSE